jgi:hypothetical protein
MEVYLKYPFDALLFFVRIDAFHNTEYNILDTILMYSQANGENVYKIPLKVVVISEKNSLHYNDIAYGDKKLLFDEVYRILE